MPIYIDPTAPTNGVGTTANPKNTWAGITLVVNETYRQKRGTVCQLPTGGSTYIHANILASDPSTPLTLEAYYYADGSDEPSLPRPEIISNLTSNGVGTVYLRKSSNVIVRNLKLNSLPQYTYNVAGVKIFAQNTGVYQNIQIVNCEIVNHAYGITPAMSSTDTGAEIVDLLIDSNDIHGNTCGIYTFFYTPLNAYIRRFTVTNNKIYDNGQRVQAGIVPGGITFNYASGATSDPTRCWEDALIGNNTVYNNEGYPIAIYNCYNKTKTSRIYNNKVYNNNHSELYDSHGIFVAHSFGLIVEDNQLSNNWGYAVGPFGTACGIIIDTDVSAGVGGDGCIVRRNTIDGGWPGYTFGGSGSESANGQAGIFIIDNTNTLIEGNFIRKFYSGIGTYANAGGTPATKLNGLVIRNNTVVDLVVSASNNVGVGISLRSGMTTLIENNILSNCRQGMWVSSILTLPTEQNNCIFAPRNGVYYAQSATIDIATPTVALNVKDTTLDPLLDTSARISSVTSPAYHTGNFSAYKRDLTNHAFWNPPSMGAYEYNKKRISRV